MMMNWRARISTDKFFIVPTSFEPKNLDIRVVSDADDLRNQDQREQEILNQLEKPFNDTRRRDPHLILSDRKFEPSDEAGGDPKMREDGEKTLLAGVQKVYQWIKRCSDFHDDISTIVVVENRDLKKVSFLGQNYEIGSTVQLHSCGVVRERELWIGKVHAMRISNLRGDLVAGRRLDKEETIELQVEWLPDEVSHFMLFSTREAYFEPHKADPFIHHPPTRRLVRTSDRG